MVLITEASEMSLTVFIRYHFCGLSVARDVKVGAFGAILKL